jgi:phosphoribosylaminoimidazole carboxylase PurE protein
MAKPIVSIIMGSESDREVMKGAEEVLEKLEIPFEVVVSSAHRDPDKTGKYAKEAKGRGIRIIIAGAGFAAHLPGFIASVTDLPVIGVPIASSPLGGIDSLLSIVQMPSGVPVGGMGVGKSGAKNAAHFAARILGQWDEEIGKRLKSVTGK